MKIKRGHYINDHTGTECFVKHILFFTVTYERSEDGENAQPCYLHYKTFARNWSPSSYYRYVQEKTEDGQI